MRLTLNLLILSTLVITGSCGQTNSKSNQKQKETEKVDLVDFELENFKPLPKEYASKDRAYLIDKIVPEKKYAYWECVYKDALTDDNRGRRIVYNGDSLSYSTYAKNVNSNNGFFVECHPGICFSYIVGVDLNKNTELIDSNAKLKNFIGQIDNIEEAILTAKLNEYWYDTDTIIGGAYRERENDYLLYLLDYSSTPVTYKSVKAVVTKDGYFSIIGKDIYKQTDEYIIE